MTTFTRPAPKPARSPCQMAAAERVRQISEEADELYTQLFEALSKRHMTTAHHVVDRLLALSAEHDAVMAAAQEDAGLKWSKAA